MDDDPHDVPTGRTVANTHNIEHRVRKFKFTVAWFNSGLHE